MQMTEALECVSSTGLRQSHWVTLGTNGFMEKAWDGPLNLTSHEARTGTGRQSQEHTANML